LESGGKLNFPTDTGVGGRFLPDNAYVEECLQVRGKNPILLIGPWGGSKHVFGEAELGRTGQGGVRLNIWGAILRKKSGIKALVMRKLKTERSGILGENEGRSEFDARYEREAPY